MRPRVLDSSLVGKSIRFNWSEDEDEDNLLTESSGECWPMGKVIQQVNDPTRKIGRSKVNYLVEYQDDPQCEHVLKPSPYNARKGAGGGGHWGVACSEQ